MKTAPSLCLRNCSEAGRKLRLLLLQRMPLLEVAQEECGLQDPFHGRLAFNVTPAPWARSPRSLCQLLPQGPYRHVETMRNFRQACTYAQTRQDSTQNPEISTWPWKMDVSSCLTGSWLSSRSRMTSHASTACDSHNQRLTITRPWSHAFAGRVSAEVQPSKRSRSRSGVSRNLACHRPARHLPWSSSPRASNFQLRHKKTVHQQFAYCLQHLAPTCPHDGHAITQYASFLDWADFVNQARSHA